MRARLAASMIGLVAARAAALAGCAYPGYALPAQPAPSVVVVPPQPAQAPAASPQTQYVPYPAYPYYTPPYTSPTYGSDADFLARLNARDIVTPDASTRTAGGRQVCLDIEAGSSITPEASKLMGDPVRLQCCTCRILCGRGDQGLLSAVFIRAQIGQPSCEPGADGSPPRGHLYTDRRTPINGTSRP